MVTSSMFNIFPDMLLEYADKLYSGELHKGKFIGKYVQEIRKLDIEDHEVIHLKYPQFVSNDSDNRGNNWLDYMLNMDKPTFVNFKKGMEDGKEYRTATMDK